MKAAPIIHTRTYNCDFLSEFIVRPSSFMDKEIKWARKIVLGATTSIDSLQGERWLVADNGRYRIAGVVGFLKNICNNCSLNDEQKKRSAELFYDNKGRMIYAFIGIATDMTDNEAEGDISYEYLWNMFLEILYPVWRRTYQESILEDFKKINLEVVPNDLLNEAYKIGKCEFYESNPIQDLNLFRYYFSQTKEKNFSFCSNLSDYNEVKQSEFTIISTSQNVIDRLKKAYLAEMKASDLDQSVENDHKQNVSIPEIKDDEKKNFVPVLMSCLVILLIIILILLLKL